MSILNSYTEMAEIAAKAQLRLRLAEAKLREHEIEWDGQQYSNRG